MKKFLMALCSIGAFFVLCSATAFAAEIGNVYNIQGNVVSGTNFNAFYGDVIGKGAAAGQDLKYCYIISPTSSELVNSLAAALTGDYCTLVPTETTAGTPTDTGKSNDTSIPFNNAWTSIMAVPGSVYGINSTETPVNIKVTNNNLSNVSILNHKVISDKIGAFAQDKYQKEKASFDAAEQAKLTADPTYVVKTYPVYVDPVESWIFTIPVSSADTIYFVSEVVMTPTTNIDTATGKTIIDVTVHMDKIKISAQSLGVTVPGYKNASGIPVSEIKTAADTDYKPTTYLADMQLNEGKVFDNIQANGSLKVDYYNPMQSAAMKAMLEPGYSYLVEYNLTIPVKYGQGGKAIGTITIPGVQNGYGTPDAKIVSLDGAPASISAKSSLVDMVRFDIGDTSVANPLASADAMTRTFVVEYKSSVIHHYGTDWTTDDKGHWHACTDAGCTIFKDYAVHDYGDWTVTKQATATEAGERARTCSVCGYVQKETIDSGKCILAVDISNRKASGWE